MVRRRIDDVTSANVILDLDFLMVFVKLYSHGRLLAARLGIFPFSFPIALVFFFLDLRKKKDKMPILTAKSRPSECRFKS